MNEAESNFLGLGSGAPRVRRWNRDGVEFVMRQRPLQRVLAFTGRSIDELVNSAVVKNEVRGYFKLHKSIQRGDEIVELERQWNG